MTPGCCRAMEDVMRTLAASKQQTEFAHKMLLTSTVPLLPAQSGINLMSSDQWLSEHHEE